MKKYIINILLLMSVAMGVYAQQKDGNDVIEVNGVVLEEATGEPMIGVNITIKDLPGLGAITDMNGKFKLKMEPYHRLVVSFIGYETQEVLIKEQQMVKVVMKEASATALDEVVVTGT